MPPIFQLDATDIKNWDKNVKEKSFLATKKYINTGNLKEIGLTSKSEICDFSTISEYFENQVDSTTIQECKSCEVKVISDQFEVHLKSRRHQKRISGLKRKEKNLEIKNKRICIESHLKNKV